MLKSLASMLSISLLMSFGVTAYAMGGDHPANQPVYLNEKTPSTLLDLINQKNRVHGYFVNQQDEFFYAGDSKAFQTFLEMYAKVDGIVGHRLTIHKGKGEAKSPWDKKKGKACDWKLDVGLISWIEIDPNHKTIFRDPEVAADEAIGIVPKPEYMAEVHVWLDSDVDLTKIKIPKTITVVREEEIPAKK